MTSDEIRQECSMRDILTRCGLPQPNRAGFIQCPFHKGDREASMKIYDRDYNCFGCGANGDIFSFIEQFYGIGFKDAFMMLGGTYEKKSSYASKLAIYRAKKAQEMKRKAAQREQSKRRLNNELISIYRSYMERSEPLSEVWCDCYNALQYQLYVGGYLEK
ncbi:MAG: CHC2 zinc finger domain-containing protein [Lachnospiraceae bacterium]|nr:CHC2 zinc finger domain-containing protein [Lachnospiraceae bacterium]